MVPSFLSPAPAAARVPPTSTAKTPYPARQRPLPFLTPLQTARDQTEKFDHEAFECFLFNAYKIEMASRQEVMKKYRKSSDSDEVYAAVDTHVRHRIKEYQMAELHQIRNFYKNHASSIQQIMRHLQIYCTGALSGQSPVSDQMIDDAIEGLKPLGDAVEFNGDEIDQYFVTAAGQLIRFNDQLQIILLKESWYNSTAAWSFYMALLGLAIGASLHFVPVVGLTLAIPIAIHWLSLLVNILTPALVGAAVVGAVAAASINFFGPAGHISRDETSTTDPILEEGVKRLLVQIVRALLLEHKIAAVDAPGTSPRLRPRSAAAAIGVAASGSLRGDELVDTGNFGEAGPPANPVAQELKFS